MGKLRTAWCQGIVFWLKERFRGPLAHLSLMDSPWALCPVAQSRFWPQPIAKTWGDEAAAESLSVVVSGRETPGRLYGKPARQCAGSRRSGSVSVKVPEPSGTPSSAHSLTRGAGTRPGPQ
ncbi:hypothetical protein [Streptomyces sp. NPDC058297]|uniref:hypothetical protein n=1 Tax=Streptomyces sp. NPDC058297 TaxID=3346433 RepID=UPI0036E2697C